MLVLEVVPTISEPPLLTTASIVESEKFPGVSGTENTGLVTFCSLAWVIEIHNLGKWNE